MCIYVYSCFCISTSKVTSDPKNLLSSVGKSTGHVLTPVIWRTAQKLRMRVAHDMIILCMCVKTSMQIVWTSHLNTWTSRKAPSLKKHFTITLISRIPALDKGSFKWNTSIIHMYIYIYNIHTTVYCQESMFKRYFSCPHFGRTSGFLHMLKEGVFFKADESRCCKSPCL